MSGTVVVDLSHHNTIADLSKTRASGILGVIYKASEGSNYKDPTYDTQRQAAQQAGLLWGAYHFLRPGNMQQQAQWFLTCAKPSTSDMLVADFEDDSMSLGDLQAWLDAIYSLTGVKAVIYSGHTLREKLGNTMVTPLTDHQLWVAHYTSAPQPNLPRAFTTWFLWQFSESGSVPGIKAPTDTNRFNGDPSDLASQWAGPVPTPEPEPTPAPMETVTITITLPRGSTIKVVTEGIT